MAWVFNNLVLQFDNIGLYLFQHGLFAKIIVLGWHYDGVNSDGLLSSEYSMVTCDFASGLRYFINFVLLLMVDNSEDLVTGRVPVVYSFRPAGGVTSNIMPITSALAPAQPLIDIGDCSWMVENIPQGIGPKHVSGICISNFPDYFSGNFQHQDRVFWFLIFLPILPVR